METSVNKGSFLPVTNYVCPDKNNVWAGKGVAAKTANTAKECFKGLLVVPVCAVELPCKIVYVTVDNLVFSPIKKINSAFWGFFSKDNSKEGDTIELKERVVSLEEALRASNNDTKEQNKAQIASLEGLNKKLTALEKLVALNADKKTIETLRKDINSLKKEIKEKAVGQDIIRLTAENTEIKNVIFGLEKQIRVLKNDKKEEEVVS